MLLDGQQPLTDVIHLDMATQDCPLQLGSYDATENMWGEKEREAQEGLRRRPHLLRMTNGARRRYGRRDFSKIRSHSKYVHGRSSDSRGRRRWGAF